MTYLLDTHAFIWFDGEPAKLSPTAAAILMNRNNRIMLSTASIWEIVIKVQIKKLTLHRSIDAIVADHLASNAVTLSQIELPHIYAMGLLPLIHRDPLDRLLVAQAKILNATILTVDPLVSQYPVSCIW